MGITNVNLYTGSRGVGGGFFWVECIDHRSSFLHSGNGFNTPSLGLSVLLFPDYTFIYLTGLFVNNKIDNLYSSGSQGIAPSRVVAPGTWLCLLEASTHIHVPRLQVRLVSISWPFPTLCLPHTRQSLLISSAK